MHFQAMPSRVKISSEEAKIVDMTCLVGRQALEIVFRKGLRKTYHAWKARPHLPSKARLYLPLALVKPHHLSCNWCKSHTSISRQKALPLPTAI